MPTLAKKIGIHVLPQDFIDYDTWQEIVLLRFRSKFPYHTINLQDESLRFFNPRTTSRFYTISKEMIRKIDDNIDKEVKAKIHIILIEKT